MPRKQKNKSIVEYKLKNGLTRYKFQIRLSDGVTRRSGFVTYEEAEIEFYNLKQKDLQGFTRPKKRTVKYCDLYDSWIAQYKNTVRETTFFATKSKFELHILPFFGNKIISKITTADCQKAVNSWSNSIYSFSLLKNYSNKIFKEALKFELIDKNPMNFVDLPKKTNYRAEIIKNRNTKNFFEKEELSRFLNFTKKHYGVKKYTYFRLLAYTGMRRGEILALNWNDVDFTNDTLNIDKTLTFINKKRIVSPTKTGINRVIDLDKKTIEILKEWKYIVSQESSVLSINNDEPIFKGTANKHMGTSTPELWLNKILKDGNFHKISLHGFRHTHATLLFDMNEKITPKDVQKRLGHTNVLTTMNIYEHATEKSKSKILTALDEFDKDTV